MHKSRGNVTRIRKLKYTVLTKKHNYFFFFVQNVDFYGSGDYNQLMKRDS